jgi:hypothetical protein
MMPPEPNQAMMQGNVAKGVKKGIGMGQDVDFTRRQRYGPQNRWAFGAGMEDFLFSSSGAEIDQVVVNFNQDIVFSYPRPEYRLAFVCQRAR